MHSNSIKPTQNKYTLFSQHPLVIDPGLACLLGLNEAIIFQQIHYWLIINEKKDVNSHEGRYWTYNSIPEWQKQFPFFSYDTIKRALKDLENKRVIISGHFHEDKRDRTKWYTIDYDVLFSLNITPNNSDSGASGQNALIESFNSLANNETNMKQMAEPPINTMPDAQGQNALMHKGKMPSCYTETNKQRLTKEEEDNFFSTKEFQPSEFLTNEIKQTYSCSDEDLQKALDEFKKWYSATKQKQETWEKYFKKWCENRKIWTKGAKPIIQAKDEEDILAGREGEEREIMTQLLQAFGEPIFKSWLLHLKLIDSNNDCVSFKVPSNFIKEWIGTNYLEDIKTIINALKPGLNRNVVLCID